MESARELTGEGNRLYGLSLYREAVDAYTRALTLGAGSECYFNRALARLRLGDYEQALQDIELYAQGKDDESGLYVKALILGRMGRYDEALGIVYRILEYNPYHLKAVEQMTYLEGRLHKGWEVLDYYPELAVKVESKGSIIHVKSLSLSEYVLSKYNRRSPFVHGFWDACLIPLLLKSDIENVLLVGSCAATIGRQYSHFTGCAVDAVDLQTQTMIECQKHFGPLPKMMTPHQAEGVRFMEESCTDYDVIIFDVFEGEYMAPAFAKPQTLALAHKRLKPDGFLVINYIMGDKLTGYCTLSNRLIASFPSVYSTSSGTNRIFTASKRPLKPQKMREMLSNPRDGRLRKLGEHLLSKTKALSCSIQLPGRKAAGRHGRKI